MNLGKDINSIRDRGGSSNIGTAEDGAIVQMIKVSGRNLILKERSIYEYILADQIDPERTNVDLTPEIQRLVLDRASESELVSRSFLTANTLFKHQFFGDTVDFEKALVISLDTLIEFCVLDNEINSYHDKEMELINWYESRRNSPSYAIPSMIDIKTRCKTIFQKIDHICQGIMEIIRLFYPEFSTKKQYYSVFFQFIEEKYGAEDPFYKFLNQVMPFLGVVRSVRNCLDHRRTEATITDFELKKDGDILTPTIEMDYEGNKITRISLDQFLGLCNKNMIYIFEIMIVQMSSKLVRPWAMLTYELRQIPKDIRRNPHIKYCFWSNLPGGYYNQ